MLRGRGELRVVALPPEPLQRLTIAEGLRVHGDERGDRAREPFAGGAVGGLAELALVLADEDLALLAAALQGPFTVAASVWPW